MGLDEFVIRHDGVICRQQALDMGLSSAAISRRISSGRWRRVSRGVYLVAGHARSPRAQARLAVGAVGPAAVLGGAAAAWWLGFIPDEPRRHVVFTSAVGDHCRRTSTSIVRHRRLCPEDVCVHRGLRVTSAALTALDAAEEIGLAALDAVLLRRFTTVDGLLQAHARYPKRHGARRVGSWLKLLGEGTRSEAERIVARIFRRAGLTGWVAGLRFGEWEIDFAFPSQMVAVEIDGFAFHRDAATFQRDRTRRNALIGAGWRVLNFTYADIVERPEAVVAQILEVLTQAA